MSYTGTFYTRAVTPIKQFCKTKREAHRLMSDDVKSMKSTYKGSGFIKRGSVRSGLVSFIHPFYGVDYYVKLDKN